MATFRSTAAYVDNRATADGRAAPVMKGRGATGLTELTTSGTAGNVQSGGSDFEASDRHYVTMVCDGAVWVSIGSSPTAAVGTDFYMKADERVELSLQSGDKISVIDDS